MWLCWQLHLSQVLGQAQRGCSADSGLKDKHIQVLWGEGIRGQLGLCKDSIFLVVVCDYEFTLYLQITLFTIPRRKKKCIRYLPGEGRCPSPFPSDDSTLGCSGSPVSQDSPSYLLLPHFPTALLASPAEPAPTSPSLSAALSLPAPWAPTGPQQCPAEYTGTAIGISEAGSLACTGHLASSRHPLFEKQQQSPKAHGNRSGALLTPS